jgi:2-hydroxy-6-oxonona-2,4-dienedioate hydrolase
MTDLATIEPATKHSAAPTFGPTSRFVQTERWKLHYNEAGSGHPVIFLHGTGPGASGWSNFSQNLGPLSQRFRVILLDLPGWGRSDRNASLTEPRNALNALAVRMLMDALGIETAAIVGNSMGGAATQHFAIEYPGRMSHYVTMGSGGGGPLLGVPTGRPPEGIRVIEDAYRDPTPENFQRLTEVMVFDKRYASKALSQSRSEAALARPELLQDWLAVRDAYPAHTPAGMLENLARLCSLKVPALLIHGRDDRAIPLEHSIRVSAAIPDARLLVFNKCGHWAQLERAAEFNAALEAFLTLHG